MPMTGIGGDNGGPTNLVLEDLVVKEFEVAGVQLSGAQNVIIRRCTVGPSASPGVSSIAFGQGTLR